MTVPRELVAIDFSKFRSNWYRPSPGELADYSEALDGATLANRQQMIESAEEFARVLESLYDNLLSVDVFNGLLQRLVRDDDYYDTAQELRTFLLKHIEVCAERTARFALTDPRRLERE